MAFDWGERRCGVAVGNLLTRSATPQPSIAVQGQARWQQIGARIADWQPDALVVAALGDAGLRREEWQPWLSNRRMRELTSLFWAMGHWGLMEGPEGAARIASWDALWERVADHADLYEGGKLVRGSLAFLERAQRVLA